jgi:hypothetical protein
MGPTSAFGVLTPWILKILGTCLILNQWSGALLQLTQLIMIHNLYGTVFDMQNSQIKVHIVKYLYFIYIYLRTLY